MKKYRAVVEIIAENYDTYEDSTFSYDFDDYVEQSNEHSNELKITEYNVLEEQVLSTDDDD